VKPYYEQDGITIYHGDCRDVLAELAPDSSELLLSDPPYGMAFGGFRGVQQNVSADGARQGIRLVRQALAEARPAMKADAHFLLFCHWESWPDFYDACSPYFPIKSGLIWHKDRGGMGDTAMEYARDYEVILYGAHGRRAIGGKRDGAVLSGFPPVRSQLRQHPTEKPVDLLSHLVAKHSTAAGCVLDPFMGSGSTLVAAKALGRGAVGIEIEESYCEIAARRLSQGVLDLGGVA
jgi:DNA modification methylase